LSRRWQHLCTWKDGREDKQGDGWQRRRRFWVAGGDSCTWEDGREDRKETANRKEDLRSWWRQLWPWENCREDLERVMAKERNIEFLVAADLHLRGRQGTSKEWWQRRERYCLDGGSSYVPERMAEKMMSVMSKQRKYWEAVVGSSAPERMAGKINRVMVKERTLLLGGRKSVPERSRKVEECAGEGGEDIE
jgi:hypothetical protein